MKSNLRGLLLTVGISAFIFLMVGGLNLIAPSVDGERSFALEEIAVDAVVDDAGTMQVTERVAYDFDGEFSVGTRTFEVGFTTVESDFAITDVQATTADGQPLATVTDTPTLFEWELSPGGGFVDGEQEYILTYTVQDAISLWDDVGELEWKWIGFGFPEVGSFTAEITMPGSGEGLRAWGHGPLNGVVSPRDGASVTFEVDGVPEGQFVESRVVVPASNFSGEPLGGPMLDQILAEEESAAEVANQNRINAEAEARQEDLARGALTVLLALAVPLSLLAFWLMWKRWGQEPPRPDDIGEYWREVPDDPPAVALALKQFGTVDSTAYAATAVDLAQRGYISIEEEEKDQLIGSSTEYRFRRTDKPAEGLLPFESTLLAMLFREGDKEITQTELQTWARAHQSTSQAKWQQFQSQVTTALGQRGYVNTGRTLPFLLPGLLGVALIGLGALAWALGAILAGVAGVGAGVLIVCLIILMRQRTPEGARRFAMWDGLGRFLEDFSRLGDDDVRVADKAVYERYLVAAVALGVSDKLVEGLRLRVPEVAADPGFAPWYVGRPSNLGGQPLAKMAGIGAFASHFGGGATSAFTPRSSGSGTGGGGFSGGGGGGGGGGGFGAR